LEVETAFVTAPEDTTLEEQRERLRILMDRGALVVLLVAVITFFAAVVNSLRGNFHLTHWIFPVVAVVLGVCLYFGADRMSKRPPHAIEVPADLAPVLNDLTIARGEVVATAPRILNPDELSEVLSDAQERHKAAFDAAGETLNAIRAGDLERASELGTEVYRHTDVIEQVRDDLQREWENSATVPEGYIGDLDDPGQQPAAAPRQQPSEPGYPTVYQSPSAPPPAQDPTRQFWSRPTSEPPSSTPAPNPRRDTGRSAAFKRPAD
jgi:hypothetical protein